MEYMFPPYSGKVDSAGKQISKIGFECQELIEEGLETILDHRSIAEECFDVIHSCETLLRYLSNSMDIPVDEIKAEVIRKNRERGYYNYGKSYDYFCVDDTSDHTIKFKNPDMTDTVTKELEDYFRMKRAYERIKYQDSIRELLEPLVFLNFGHDCDSDSYDNEW